MSCCLHHTLWPCLCCHLFIILLPINPPPLPPLPVVLNLWLTHCLQLGNVYVSGELSGRQAEKQVMVPSQAHVDPWQSCGWELVLCVCTRLVLRCHFVHTHVWKSKITLWQVEEAELLLELEAGSENECLKVVFRHRVFYSRWFHIWSYSLNLNNLI